LCIKHLKTSNFSQLILSETVLINGYLLPIQNDIMLTGNDPSMSFQFLAATKNKQTLLLRRLWNTCDKTEIISLTKSELFRNIREDQFSWRCF
jgi:hypothetical protein